MNSTAQRSSLEGTEIHLTSFAPVLVLHLERLPFLATITSGQNLGLSQNIFGGALLEI